MGKERSVLSALLITNLNINKAPKIAGFHVHSLKKKSHFPVIKERAINLGLIKCRIQEAMPFL